MDKYDQAIQYFKTNPDEIHAAWERPWHHQHGSLFIPCGDSSRVSIGCPIQIKSGLYQAQTKELTNMIRQDPLLPSDDELVGVDHLERFAFWQRKIDQILPNRGQPVGSGIAPVDNSEDKEIEE